MALFAFASLTPLPLFALGIWLGGAWLWAGVLYMSVFAIVLDQALPHVAGDAPEGAEFPAADALLVAIGVAHLGALPLVTWAVAGDSGLDTGGRVLLALGAGFWFGQVAHPAAHELIHRPGRWMYRLGVAVYVSLLFGQHASAHRLVHHRHVATDADPNSARPGEGFYRFALRAWAGSFREGWRAEDALRARATAGARGLHPYAVYIGGGLAALAVAAAVAGATGVLVWAGMALHAQSQLLLSDYVQHYGLRRAVLPDGRTEPVGPRHSWNTGHWFTSALMLNAPRHSDHHAHPARPYPALRLPDAETAPRLPWPLPVACAIALAPRLWRRAMKPHLARWRAAVPPGGGVTGA
jgi:alkane 1-monooxygenase